MKSGGVETWRRNGPLSHATETRPDQPSASTTTTEETRPVLIGSGSSAKHEMLLERLPYIAIVMRNRTPNAKAGNLGDIEKITAFSGIGGSSEDAPEDEDRNTDLEQWSTDPPTVEKGKIRKPSKSSRAGNSSAIPAAAVESEVAKLVLSDDDIEDD